LEIAMKIGELAKATDCAVETIRYYEREQPAAGAGPQRWQLPAVHPGPRRAADLHPQLPHPGHDPRRNPQPAAPARQPGGQCGSVNALIDEHIEHVQARIDGLLALQAQLVELRQRAMRRG
jgi:DNA-binding transcriptional MerR regulator